MTKIWRYVVRYDDGLAPCVENGYLSLACCKPVIRKGAIKDDWVVGFHKKAVGDAMLCYAMRVTEHPIPYMDYWNDHRFRGRRDNIYRFANGKLEWVRNAFSDHDDETNHETDRSGRQALVSQEYWYFNEGESFSLYDHLDEAIVSRLLHAGRGQKYNGLLDGDFPALLRYLDQNRPKGSGSEPKMGARRNSC